MEENKEKQIKYKNPFVDESAFEGDEGPKPSEDEVLMEEAKQAQQEAQEEAQRKEEEARREKEEKEREKEEKAREKEKAARKKNNPLNKVLSSAASTVGREVGKKLVRGILGSLKF